MISVEQLTIRFGAFELFSQASVLINPKDRVGLVGKNGAGKTTLLKVFAGLHPATEGNVVVPDNVKIGYLPQQMIHKDGKTVYEETCTAFDEILGIKRQIEETNLELGNRTDYESDHYLSLINSLTEASERFELLGGESYHANIEQVLIGLGFERTDFNRSTSEFSGGWRMRIELAKILLQKPDVLLLDEPTNHLDIESIQWLENFVKNFHGAMLVISHDKAFLDNTTHRTIEISLGKFYDYKAHYSKSLELRKERREQQLASYRNQQKLIEETKSFIERFRYKATKAVQVQSRIKQLEKLDIIEVEEEDKSAINVRFPAAPRAGTIVIEADGLSKHYGNNCVLKNIDLIIERGEKVAFVGRNGEGKTTLSKIIVGDTDYTGELKKGHNLKIGYFAQNQDELMNEQLTVFQTIDKVAVGDIRTKIRDILGAFLFSGEDIDKKVSVLSGGERSRLAMAKLLLEPYNLLVLDEPTNHLDIRSKEILKNALVNYDGTLILVSHDRDFLTGLCNKVYEFRNKKIRNYPGDIYDYLKYKNLESLKQLERQNKQVVEKPKSSGTNKEIWQTRKEFDKRFRQLERKLEETEKEIEKLETQLAEMDELLSNPHKAADLINDPAWFKKYETLKEKLNNKMHTWEEISIKAEDTRNDFKEFSGE
jgi:ATP-binding cassette, subfamily F, member 3